MKLKSFRYAMLGGSCLCTVLQGFAYWMPSLLIRIFGQNTAEVGFSTGLAISIAAIVSYTMGGSLTSRLVRRDLRWYVWFAATAGAISIPLATLTSLSLSITWAIVGFFLLMLVLNSFLPAIYDWGQYIAIGKMRGTIVMVIGVFLNFISGMIGFPALGAINDALTPWFGHEAIRYGLLTSVGFLGVGILLFLLSSRYLLKEMEMVDRMK